MTYRNSSSNKTHGDTLFLENSLDVYVDEYVRTPSKSELTFSRNTSSYNYTCSSGKNVTVNHVYFNRYEHVGSNGTNSSHRGLQNVNVSNSTTVVTRHVQNLTESYFQEYFNFTRLPPCNFTGQPWCLSVFRNISSGIYSDAHYYYNPNITLLNYTTTNYNRTYYKVFYNKYYNGSQRYKFQIPNGTYNETYNETRGTSYIEDVASNRTNATNYTMLNENLLYLSN